MDRFTLSANTLSKTVKDNPADRIEVEIGDSKQLDFKPQFKIKRWDNEVNFSMRAIEEAGATMVEEDGKVKYKGRNVEVHQYEKPDASEDGGYEFEWVLNKKPESNVLRTTIQHKGLDFFYQPEITDEEALASMFDGDKRTLEEIKREMRPENVVGSYAVYHSTKQNNFVGGMEYQIGKAFHIYRPHAVDADGVKVWCELDIKEGELTVTVPEDFLNKASYPVVVDPTFGYTSAGASNMSLYDNNSYRDTSWIVGGDYTLSEAGDVSSISIYVGALPASYSKLEVFGGIWTKGAVNTSYRSARTGEHIHTDSFTTTGWKEMSYSTQPSLSADDYKLIAFGGADGAGNYQSMTGKYDTTGASNGITPYNTGYPAGSIPATGWEYLSDVNVFEVGDYPVRAVADRKVSIYATYTAAASYNPAFAHRRLLL